MKGPQSEARLVLFVAAIVCASASRAAAQDGGVVDEQVGDGTAGANKSEASATLKDLKTKNQKLKDELASAKGDLAQANKDLAQANKDLETVGEYKHQLEHQLEQKQAELDEKNGEIEEKKKKVEIANRQYSAKKKELADAKRRERVLKVEAGDKGVALREAREETKSLEGEVDKKKRILDEKQKELEQSRANAELLMLETRRQQRALHALRRYKKRSEVATLFILIGFALVVLGLAFRALRQWRSQVRRMRRRLSEQPNDPVRRAAIDEFVHHRALVEVIRPVLSITVGFGVVGVSLLVLTAVEGLYGMSPTEGVLKQLLDGSLWRVVVGIFAPVGALSTLYIATQSKLRESIALCNQMGLPNGDEKKGEEPPPTEHAMAD